MKKVFSFLRCPSMAAMDSSTKPGTSGVGATRPLFRDKDMGAIHKAASVGNVRKVKQILFFRKSALNDRDRMSRTALHVACGKGHPRVVRLLTHRHCLLNLCDVDNKTPLIHAIQYEQEECVKILLDHGADPNVEDIHGNNALHYALLGHNTAIVEKLLSCMENTEARNKDDFTPLSPAKYENKEKMVTFLVSRGSKVNHLKRKKQVTLEYKEGRRIRSESSNLGMQRLNSEGPQEAYNQNSNASDLQESQKQALSKTKSKTVHEISEEDSLCRNGLTHLCCIFFYKPRIIDSCPTSDHEVSKVVEQRNYTQSQLSQEQDARIIHDGIPAKHLCKPKEIEIAHKKINSEEYENSDKEKRLFQENHMFWDEIDKLKLERDTVKNQNQEMGKIYFEDIAIVKEKTDCLEKIIRETVFQQNAQLEVLGAECRRLNYKLENEQQNRRRLEAEIESYQSRLATVVQDQEHCQASKGDLQLAVKRARDEWLCLSDNLNFDMSNLKHNNEILYQKLSKAGSKSNNLEIELHHTRDALKEWTMVLEKDLIQEQCHQEETEHVYADKQGEVDKVIGKQESLHEKILHLQSENMLLQEQLDQAHNKADREEKIVINIQNQIKNKISTFNAESIKQIIILNERINQLTKEWDHYKERLCHYENENVERDAFMRNLQQELTDTPQKITMIAASLEVESCHPVLSQYKTHHLKKNLDESRNQNDELTTKLQASSSKCICLDEGKTPPQELSVEALLKRREELKDRVKRAKQEAVNLRKYMKINMVESCEVEEYKKKIEERARRAVADSVEQGNSF